MEFLTPLVAHAITSGAPSTSVKLLMYRISFYILNPLIMVGFVVAIIYFFWGVVEYIRDRDSGHVLESGAFGKDGKNSSGPDRIVYGLIGLFIMVSVFGILRLIKSLIGSDVAIGG